AKVPDERHHTAREFARSLKEAVEKPPSPQVEFETEPPTPPRKPFLSRIVLSLAIVLLLGAGGWWAVSHFAPSPDTDVIGDSPGGGQDNPRAPAPAPIS